MGLEYCIKCDEPTGHAGAGEDSLYGPTGDGPYCVSCYDELYAEAEAESEER